MEVTTDDTEVYVLSNLGIERIEDIQSAVRSMGELFTPGSYWPVRSHHRDRISLFEAYDYELRLLTFLQNLDTTCTGLSSSYEDFKRHTIESSGTRGNPRMLDPQTVAVGAFFENIIARAECREEQSPYTGFCGLVRLPDKLYGYTWYILALTDYPDAKDSAIYMRLYSIGNGYITNVDDQVVCRPVLSEIPIKDDWKYRQAYDLYDRLLAEQRRKVETAGEPLVFGSTGYDGKEIHGVLTFPSAN